MVLVRQAAEAELAASRRTREWSWQPSVHAVEMLDVGGAGICCSVLLMLSGVGRAVMVGL